MKLRLLLFAVFVSLASCSGDDSSPVDENPNPQPVNKVLYQTENFNYELPSQPFKQVVTFENDKPVSGTSYDQAGNIEFTAVYTYYESGNLKKHEVLRPNGTAENAQLFEYDAQGRLTKYTRDAVSSINYLEVTDYIYNSDNTITATETVSLGGTPQVRVYTFYLNENNKVFKIKEPSFNSYYYYEVEYSNSGLIVALSQYFEDQLQTVRNFVYNDVEPKGAYVKRYNIYGGLNNEILKAKGFYSTSKPQYVLSASFSFIAENVTLGATDFENTFDFDTDGYPVSEKNFVDGEMTYKTNIIYQETE